jgi:hypothetical protein
MIVKFFAFFGATVATFSLFGALGIGHFYSYYGPEPVHCIKGKL